MHCHKCQIVVELRKIAATMCSLLGILINSANLNTVDMLMTPKSHQRLLLL